MHMTSHEGRPAALGVKRGTATCVIAKHAARGATHACHTAGLDRLGPRTERLSANAHCQHNTCALRDTSLVSLLWRCDPLWRQCIRSINKETKQTTLAPPTKLTARSKWIYKRLRWTMERVRSTHWGPRAAHLFCT